MSDSEKNTYQPQSEHASGSRPGGEHGPGQREGGGGGQQGGGQHSPPGQGGVGDHIKVEKEALGTRVLASAVLESRKAAGKVAAGRSSADGSRNPLHRLRTGGFGSRPERPHFTPT
ncbi:MAG: hypothetical protein ACRD2B_01320 [Terriglobia bacterium]